jgi:uncharacterized protein
MNSNRTLDDVIESSEKRLKNADLRFKRYIFDSIDKNERLIGLTGARGVGKTTLLLQKLKELNLPSTEAFYISLDDIYFITNGLLDLATDFVKRGGKYLFLDEVHKYETWSIELKNIYDIHPELKVMFTGSSVLEMSRMAGDLSRRAMIYKLETMSFREYLVYECGFDIKPISIIELSENHIEIANDLIDKGLKPFKYFENYLKYGAYPFSLENKATYFDKLFNTLNLIFENDLPACAGIDYSTGVKLKKLLISISESVPFKPNIVDMAAKIGTDRRNIYTYLEYLRKARLINTLISDEKGMNSMVKPEMIYLENTSLAYLLNGNRPEKGMLRETFFYNQLESVCHVSYTPAGDFLINNKYIYEVGGKNKTFKQIKNLPASYLAMDDLETGHGNKIPLWLFGLVR